MRVSAVFAVWFCSAIPVLLRKNVDQPATRSLFLRSARTGPIHPNRALTAARRKRAIRQHGQAVPTPRTGNPSSNCFGSFLGLPRGTVSLPNLLPQLRGQRDRHLREPVQAIDTIL